jgi:hypothetical protein
MKKYAGKFLGVFIGQRFWEVGWGFLVGWSADLGMKIPVNDRGESTI